MKTSMHVVQKQPPEVFYKKCYSKKFDNIHRKTPALQSIFNKVAGLQVSNFIKKRFQYKCSSVNIAKNFKNIFFKEHLGTAATGWSLKLCPE